MKLASYNVENLFERPAIMNLADWDDGKEILGKHAELTRLLESEAYTGAVKEDILDLADELGIKKSGKSKYVELKEVRGKLFRRPAGKPVEVVQAGRAGWVGWAELVKEPMKERQVANTARVIKDVGADIIGIVEAEHRTGLQAFNDQAIRNVGGKPYDHVMLIDGNDERGIDVGLMTRKQYPIDHLRSHVDDRDGNSRIFSRDCPEYCVRLPAGGRLWVLVNHFKSKGFGAAAASNARRKKQAQRVREIYDGLIARGETLVAVIGDMNDVPDSDPLAPLLQNGSTLKDIFTSSKFDDGGRPGTHGNCTASAKLDYILLSPALFSNIDKAGVFRMGMWGGKNGDMWQRYDDEVLGGPQDVASDHAALWVDLNLG